MRRLVLISGAVYGVVLLILGLWVAADTQPPPRVELDHSREKPQGGIYSLALPQPSTLNPFTTIGAVAKRMVLPYTHDSLMEYDPKTATLRPALAEKVEEFESGKRLVFTLRADVRFSNGAKLGMGDVLFTYELHKAGVPLGTVVGALQNVTAMRALDSRRLEVRLETRMLNSLEDFATGYVVGNRVWCLAQVARVARESGGAVPKIDDDRFGSVFAEVQLPGPGTGPYFLERWNRGEDLYLIQNPYSWRRKARPADWNLAGVRMLFNLDGAAGVAMAKNGELDLFLTPSPKALIANDADLARTHRALVYDHQRNGHYVLFWNHRDTQRHLHVPAVRRALTKLFDRDRIVAEVFQGSAKRSRTWFRPGSEYDGKAEIPFDVKGARADLQKAGVSDLRVEVLIATGQPIQRKILEIAAPTFEAAGVVLTAVPMEKSAMAARLRSGQFQGGLVVVGLTPGIADPYWHFDRSKIGGEGLNWAAWDHEEASQLLRQGRTTLDPKVRAEAYRKFNEIFVREQPVTMLAHPLSSIVLAKRFRGVDENLGKLGLVFEKWWLPRNQ